MLLITGRLLDWSYRPHLSAFINAVGQCKYGEVSAIIKGNIVDIRERCIHRTSAARRVPKGTKIPIDYDSKSMPTYCIGKLTDAMIIGNTITFVVECGPEMVKGVEAEAVYANSAQGTVCLRGPCEGGYYGRGWSLLGNSGDQWIGFAIACGILLLLVIIVSVVLHLVQRRKAEPEAGMSRSSPSSRDDNDSVDVELSSRKTNQTSTSNINSDQKQ
uniref:ZP domain-containing protein n=1 Tax=Ascaris lumbricoides TaxID=6252 RepID=A0A0M3IJG3_ASCLU